MSYSDHGDDQAETAPADELREAVAHLLQGRDDLTVTELVRLAVELDVPAADVLAEWTVSPARPAGRPPGRRRPRRP